MPRCIRQGIGKSSTEGAVDLLVGPAAPTVRSAVYAGLAPGDGDDRVARGPQVGRERAH
eukprot:gene19255-38525_t